MTVARCLLSSSSSCRSLGALVLLACPTGTASGTALIRQLALGVSLVVFAATLLLWCRFDRARRPSFQFVERVAWIPAFGIDYHLGVDGISLLLLVLTGFLTPLALLSSWESIHTKRQGVLASSCCALETGDARRVRRRSTCSCSTSSGTRCSSRCTS